MNSKRRGRRSGTVLDERIKESDRKLKEALKKPSKQKPLMQRLEDKRIANCDYVIPCSKGSQRMCENCENYFDAEEELQKDIDLPCKSCAKFRREKLEQLEWLDREIEKLKKSPRFSNKIASIIIKYEILNEVRRRLK